MRKIYHICHNQCYKILIALIVFVIMCVDMSKMTNILMLNILYKNCVFINTLLFKYKYIICTSVLILGLLCVKIHFTIYIDKIQWCGITFICNKSEMLLQQNITHYLNTKRTLFYINCHEDNFYDVIESYYDVYKFIKNKMLPYNINNVDNKLYNTINNMIKDLNLFLTKHQDNYIRWYKYVIKQQQDKIYNVDISEIQCQYRHYNSLIIDFNNINKKFIEYGKVFNLKIEKWRE